jgi:hypothetical protein
MSVGGALEARERADGATGRIVVHDDGLDNKYS